MSSRPWQTPLSSLVVTLSRDPDLARLALDRIRDKRGLTLGELEGQYLPLVIEDADARPIHRWLEALPGVENVDVVFCAFDSESAHINP
ncbi:hypothetical protein [Pelagicoccus sp. SDUM812003]|uniref:hypothetical protein n=1 Tax=Pelagicoccus sp. SDUM812003 TaxID=3041267 RepID=UPI0028103DBD|nr:hypothetical protein [Pelagicoccus sp. SDUM812003]MDQ8202412.1 hypothetical protein [Pelagicoccus sp. SDUM812003]